MRLRKLELKDISGMQEWMYDPDVNQYFRFQAAEMTEDRIKAFIEYSFNEQNRHYAIVSDCDIYQGTVSLKNINYEDENAEYAISLRKNAQGKGLAKEATDEIFRIAFNELNLQKVYLNVLSSNVRAIKFYEKMGFRHIGKTVKHVKIHEELQDLEWYEILREDMK